MNLSSSCVLICGLACLAGVPALAQTPPRNAAAAAAVATPPPPAAPIAGALTPDVVERALALARSAAAALAPAGARVVVAPGRVDPRLTLAPCAAITPYLGKGLPAWGRTRIGLRCDDGSVRWNVFLPLVVQVWAPAPVAGSALPAGARLAEVQFATADIDWAAAPQPPLAEARLLAGRTLARPLAAGQPVRPADLQPRVWFAIGERVRVQATGNGFAVHGEGQALGPGLEGQPVRVRVGDEGSQRVVVGRAVGEGRVEIRL